MLARKLERRFFTLRTEFPRKLCDLSHSLPLIRVQGGRPDFFHCARAFRRISFSFISFHRIKYKKKNDSRKSARKVEKKRETTTTIDNRRKEERELARFVSLWPRPQPALSNELPAFSSSSVRRRQQQQFRELSSPRK